MDGESFTQEPPRVRFGPRPTQVVPIEVADVILTALCQRNRKMFGDLLQMAMIEGRDALNGERR